MSINWESYATKPATENIDWEQYAVDQPSVQNVGQEDRGYFTSPYMQYGLVIFALIGFVLSVKQLCNLIPLPKRLCGVFHRMKVLIIKFLIWMVLFVYFTTHFNMFVAFDLAIILIYGRDLKNIYERVIK